MARRAKDRQGRGRLSSIDLLPEDADDDVAWALEQLRERKMLQVEILVEFNRRLEAKGIDPISPSAWGRYALRKANQFRRLDEAQRISAELVSSLDANDPDQLTIAIGEMVKTAAFELLEGDLDTKGLMELSRAVQGVVGAQKTSSENRRRMEREVAERVEDAADRVEESLREAGLSEERLAEMRKRFLGVK